MAFLGRRASWQTAHRAGRSWGDSLLLLRGCVRPPPRCRAPAPARVAASPPSQHNAEEQVEHQPGQQALQLDVQPTHHVDPSSFDTDVFHYRSRLGWPAWLSPTSIVAAGITFFVASVALDHDEPLLKTVLLAAGPVALFWAVFLLILPRSFERFAVSYLESHPEAEAAALAQAAAAAAAAQQDQLQEQQQVNQQQQQQ